MLNRFVVEESVQFDGLVRCCPVFVLYRQQQHLSYVQGAAKK